MAIARLRWVMSMMALLLVSQSMVVRRSKQYRCLWKRPPACRYCKARMMPQPTLITDIVYAEYETSLSDCIDFIRCSGRRLVQAVGAPLPWILYVQLCWFPNLARAIPNMIDFSKQTGFAVASRPTARR